MTSPFTQTPQLLSRLLGSRQTSLPNRYLLKQPHSRLTRYECIVHILFHPHYISIQILPFNHIKITLACGRKSVSRQDVD